MREKNDEGIVHWVLHYSYLKEDILGEGATGKVYQGMNQKTGEKVAIKVIDMSSIDNEVTRYLLTCEKEALQTIDHPNVLKAYDIIQTQDHCFFVTPLCEGGTLKERIRNKGKLAEKEAIEIIHKVLEGYGAIKEKGFIHRDLKAMNIMFRNGEPLIIDFGYCEKLTGDKPKIFYNVGSPSYMSPQAYYKTIYSEKSDLWALGVMFFEMLDGHTIDHGLPINRYFNIILKNGYSLKSLVSTLSHQLLRNLLEVDVGRRSSTGQILNLLRDKKVRSPQRGQRNFKETSPRNKFVEKNVFMAQGEQRGVHKLEKMVQHQKGNHHQHFQKNIQDQMSFQFRNHQAEQNTHKISLKNGHRYKSPVMFHSVLPSQQQRGQQMKFSEKAGQFTPRSTASKNFLTQSSFFGLENGIVKLSQSILREQRSLDNKAVFRKEVPTSAFEMQKTLHNSKSNYIHPKDSFVSTNSKIPSFIRPPSLLSPLDISLTSEAETQNRNRSSAQSFHFPINSPTNVAQNPILLQKTERTIVHFRNSNEQKPFTPTTSIGVPEQKKPITQSVIFSHMEPQRKSEHYQNVQQNPFFNVSKAQIPSSMKNSFSSNYQNQNHNFYQEPQNRYVPETAQIQQQQQSSFHHHPSQLLNNRNALIPATQNTPKHAETKKVISPQFGGQKQFQPERAFVKKSQYYQNPRANMNMKMNMNMNMNPQARKHHFSPVPIQIARSKSPQQNYFQRPQLRATIEPLRTNYAKEGSFRPNSISTAYQQ